jgi:hypothetical protein
MKRVLASTLFLLIRGLDNGVNHTRLMALNERFKPLTILAEANSMGLPLIENLQSIGLPVVGFTTTNATKAAIIDGLVLAFEGEKIRILPDVDLIEELQAFEAERLPSGLMRYAAPGGLHDDAVISLALAWVNANRSGGVGGSGIWV